MARPLPWKDTDMTKTHATQATIKRILAGAEAAGLSVDRFEVTADGNVIVFTNGDAASEKGPNEWDTHL